MLRIALATCCALAFAPLALAPLALAQVGNGVNSGLSANGTLQGANVNNVNGINANGTPKAQSPGASMTVGAGNSTMIPGTAGGITTPPLAPLTPAAPVATPTISGAVPPPVPNAP